MARKTAKSNADAQSGFDFGTDIPISITKPARTTNQPKYVTVINSIDWFGFEKFVLNLFHEAISAYVENNAFLVGKIYQVAISANPQSATVSISFETLHNATRVAENDEEFIKSDEILEKMSFTKKYNPNPGSFFFSDYMIRFTDIMEPLISLDFNSHTITRSTNRRISESLKKVVSIMIDDQLLTSKIAESTLFIGVQTDRYSYGSVKLHNPSTTS